MAKPEMQRTLIIVKPDAVQRGLIGQVLQRLERRGLKLVALKLMAISHELAAQHYGEHAGKGFYPGLVNFITSGPVVVGVVEGPSAIDVVRATAGATRPAEAAPGTIRADFGLTVGQNIIHASDGPESARREIALFFAPGDLVDYQRVVDQWINDPKAE